MRAVITEHGSTSGVSHVMGCPLTSSKRRTKFSAISQHLACKASPHLGNFGITFPKHVIMLCHTSCDLAGTHKILSSSPWWCKFSYNLAPCGAPEQGSLSSPHRCATVSAQSRDHYAVLWRAFLAMPHSFLLNALSGLSLAVCIVFGVDLCLVVLLQ